MSSCDLWVHLKEQKRFILPYFILQTRHLRKIARLCSGIKEQLNNFGHFLSLNIGLLKKLAILLRLNVWEEVQFYARSRKTHESFYTKLGGTFYSELFTTDFLNY
jgi:hypothetical protein